ncbi:MAG TPA: sigma-54 dependent transcriptional regulator [Pyrinomonadaceae bacterium]|nr:sigma-54 dependent transcriptional regulator [Pyrinomonadaceae bacterium]
MKAHLPNTILVVDDDRSITGALATILRTAGYETLTTNSIVEAKSVLSSRSFDLVITDLRLADGTGIDLITHIKKQTPDTEVILMTGFGSIEIAIEAIKRGAYYYLEKPHPPDQLLALVERALQFAALRIENQTLKRSLVGDSELFGLVGRDPRIRRIHETIRTAAPSDASVLIEGESGTGKELIAKAVHTESLRVSGPFVSINCAAIPHELIESELFGYKKGAFTGAQRDKRGLIEVAEGGTLLLDEIAEMPAHLQTKLLRVLQERKLRRLGDEREIEVNFRLVSATNRDTSLLLKQGVLRKDLYFRISTIKIKVPPLRQRRDDIILLAKRLLQRFNQQYEKSIGNISQDTVTRLTHYDWPGNVRELESVIERAVLFCQGDELTVADLPDELQDFPITPNRVFAPPSLSLEEIERDVILQTLERTSGNVKKSAEILRVHRPTFYRKLKKFGIKVERESGSSGSGYLIVSETSQERSRFKVKQIGS